MAAFTGRRDTKERQGINQFNYPVAANAVIQEGALVATNAAGFLVEVTAATGLDAVGRAEQRVDNTGGANGALRCDVRAGRFKWANSTAGDAITIANRGAVCYGVDNQTVALTNGANTRSVAGVIEDVDADGVWVFINPLT